MRWLLMAGLLATISTASGCAPRNPRTHFDRWADETKKRHAKEAEEKAAETNKASAESPPVKQGEPPRTSSTKTATKSAVARPASTGDKKPADEDAIY